jgi:sulfite exporter TauE/SafE
MSRVVIEGWLLGLSTGPYCLGACAPFLVPFLLAEGATTWRRNAALVAEFLLGRLVAYLAFGAVIGWLGDTLKPHLSQRLASTALVVTSALMILYAVVKGLPRWKLCAATAQRLPLQRLPFVLGLLIGINACPPFLVAMARIIQLGGAATGAIFFLGFFAGTTLLTIPLLAVSPVTRSRRAQRLGTLATVLVGLWFLLTAWLGR